MVQEDIVLGHLISSKGLEVDKVKIAIIQTPLTPPTTVRDVRSFLGHASFYQRFIKDFSKITKLLCKLLEKDVVGYIKVHHLYRVSSPSAHVLLSFCVEYVLLTFSTIFMRVQVVRCPVHIFIAVWF